MPNIRNAPAGVRFLAAGLLGLAFATPAMATDSDVVVNQNLDTRMIEVKISDLDFSNSFDRDTLEIRINNAAEAVCDIAGGSKMMDRLPEAKACFAEAKKGAIAQLAARGVPAKVLAGG